MFMNLKGVRTGVSPERWLPHSTQNGHCKSSGATSCLGIKEITSSTNSQHGLAQLRKGLTREQEHKHAERNDQ